MSRAELPIHSTLAAPHGGTLVNLLVPEREREALIAEAAMLPAVQLSAIHVALLGRIATGAFSPLHRFMGREDFQSVWQSMRLRNGMLFPWPVTLQVRKSADFREGADLTLRDSRNYLLGVLKIEEIFEAQPVAGEHEVTDSLCSISGSMRLLKYPEPLLFPGLHRTPAELRETLRQASGSRILAADAWDPRDSELTAWMRHTAEALNATLLLNLPVQEERIDDFELYTRLRGWKRNFDLSFGRMGVLNFLNMPHAAIGPRRLLLNAIVHKNYGANAYLCNPAEAIAQQARDTDSPAISEAELRSYLIHMGVQPISPSPDLVPTTRNSAMARSTERSHASGFCVWLTGLPGAGKSTLSERLAIRLMDHGRKVTLLDGDVVRTHLSKGLSFSREDRDANVQRIGFVAAEVVRHGGIAICAAVSPYRFSRRQVRNMMPAGAFIEVFVDTPAAVCEQRDMKGFYGKARSGQIKSFTGVNDPYESPENPEIRIDTCASSAEDGERRILDFLREHHLGTAAGTAATDD